MLVSSTQHIHVTAAAAAWSLQSCPALGHPMDCSPPGSSVRGILQARILEEVAMPSSRGLPDPEFEPGSPALQADSLLLLLLLSSFSCVQLSATPWTAAYQAPPSMGFSRQEYWSGVPLPSPEWVAIPFSYHLLEFALIHALSQ